MRRDNFKWLFYLVLGVLIGMLIGKYTLASTQSHDTKVEITVKKDSIVTKKDTLYVKRVTKPSLNDNNLMAELKLNKIQHPEIVLAQARLETGGYTSKVCRTCNNLFGLRKGDSYRSFSHWTESVKEYKRLIQSRYKGGNYYAFLERIGYADCYNYTDKVRQIVNNIYHS